MMNAAVLQRMEISLSSLAQLFNSMDPAPFYERDLDQHAEHYLVSWAQELPENSPLELIIHLRGEAATPATQAYVREGLSHYFGERSRLAALQLRDLLRQGRASLLIGIGFLFVCLALGSFFAAAPRGSIGELLHQSLTIVGWVAMWRPLEIYLYDWWPLRRQMQLYRRLQNMPVSLRETEQPAPMVSASVARRPDPQEAPVASQDPLP